MVTTSRLPEPRYFGPDDVGRLLPWDDLLASIEDVVVREDAFAPGRTVHSVPGGDGSDAAFLLKPGWVAGDVIVVKAVTFFPNNGELNLPTVNAGGMLFSGADGTFLGACDGNELTTRRTAAASAVAAKRLARADSKRLLIVGTGALAPMTARAHCSVREFEAVDVWGRNAARAREVADCLVAEDIPARVADELDAAVSEANVISCSTGSTTPLVKGKLLQPGTHVDLIGAFTPQMRESDDDVVCRSTLFLDTRDDGTLAGDLAQPLASGAITMDDIAADLTELVAGVHPGRTSDDEITMFKSAGFALEDVAAARLVFASSETE